MTERGLVDPDLWRRTCDAAVALFRRGQYIASAAGLILVDTKYEFGTDDAGELSLIDEVHTPDSSRYWKADTYEARTAQGLEPENFDKEFVRLHYAALGYRGEGEPMPLPVDLAVEAAQRYITIYEMLTGQPFTPGELPAQPRIQRNIDAWLRQSALSHSGPPHREPSP